MGSEGKADGGPARARVQYGTLPYRVGEGGGVEVLLVTSRETRRWVIPKGNPMRGLKPHKAAAREAYEEAGAKGATGKRPIGSYLYWKRLRTSFDLVAVAVYPLAVSRLKDAWPEREQRERRWFPAEVAADLVDEPGLRALIRAFAANRA